MKLILASNSARRKEILSKNGYDFEIVVSNYQELKDTKDVYALTVDNALGKAKDVFDKVKKSYDDYKNRVVLGADTVVYFENKILGKPTSKADAFNMIKSYSGKKHIVITGYALVSYEKIYSAYTVTEVECNILNDTDIIEYVESGLPLDKAGSYGIQDGFKLVKEYRGSLTNVIGLPIEDVSKALKEFGVFVGK